MNGQNSSNNIFESRERLKKSSKENTGEKTIRANTDFKHDEMSGRVLQARILGKRGNVRESAGG